MKTEFREREKKSGPKTSFRKLLFSFHPIDKTASTHFHVIFREELVPYTISSNWDKFGDEMSITFDSLKFTSTKAVSLKIVKELNYQLLFTIYCKMYKTFADGIPGITSSREGTPYKRDIGSTLA